MSDSAVMRIARRKARPDCGAAYEALVRGMFGDARTFPGFMGAEVIPPESADGEYQVVLKFATATQMAAWDASEVRQTWHTRLDAVADGPPEYRRLTGLEAWFIPASLPANKPPSRARMAFVSWLGIFPTVALLQLTIFPYMTTWPFLLRIGVFTALVVLAMTWLVMPRLTRWLRPWLAR
jgi:antibiotic biosynthesis monooxygenase (ABM) superfamily enzyme